MSIKLLELDPQRRDAILNSALKEFSMQGYDNASTNIIAKNAGISKALMFHYVSNKQELFLVVYDYFTRLRQSYFLQIKMSEKYPWILDFNKLSRPTNSAEVNEELESRAHKEKSSCYPKLFDNIDETKFRKGLNIEKCKQLIFWSNVGFADQLLEKIREQKSAVLDSATIISELDDYFVELRKVFYEISDK